MASYHFPQRDPLLDQTTQAMLERRGKELAGLVLIGLALAFLLLLGTYSPKDPGWMVSTDEPAANFLGRPGAAIASTLVIITGRGAWAIPIVLFVWGVRFMRHVGADRASSRAIFAPLAVILCAIYAAGLTPQASWTQSFGLGGLLGDAALGALLGVFPTGPDMGLRILPPFLGLAMVLGLFFVTGFDRAELRVLGYFFRNGLIQVYDMILGKAGNGAQRAMDAARTRMENRRSAGPLAATGHPQAGLRRADDKGAMMALGATRVRRAPPPVTFDEIDPDSATAPEWAPMAAHRSHARYAEPLADQAYYAPPSEKTGLFGRVAGLMARRPDPEPELVERAFPEDTEIDLLDEDRIRARISSAVKTRNALTPMNDATPTTTGMRREPGLSRARGPEPLIIDPLRATGKGMGMGMGKAAPNTLNATAGALRAEPPVMAAKAAGLLAAGAGLAMARSAMATGTGLKPSKASDFGPDIRNAFSEIDEDDDLGDWESRSALLDDIAAPLTGPSERRGVVQHVAKKPAAQSSRARAEAEPRLRFDEPASAYELPPLGLLSNPVSIQRNQLSDEALEENARMLESVLDDYGVRGEIVSVRPGPVVTMYELEPAPGLKASRVIGLADDIARSMSALSARVSTVPGRTVIGIELPNTTREKVLLREILAARDFGDSNLRLPLALGKDIGGDPVVANLAKMPHLLIAGTTGSGKSVAINTMILSLLYKLTPEECRLIMIDPKMLELSVYDGIPHLLSPVVTDPKKAVVALKWVVGEMEERYRKMSKMGVRNIEGYNGRVREALDKGELFKRTIQTGFDEETGDPVFETEEFAPVSLPYIVVIVDEMADLMMVAGKEIEACIQRLAQMARASGIHLIMATQRPSVDVITGTIKANFPTRISFQVTSKIDSRTILGEQGAEQLLGMGDMLYMAGGGRISRIHGPFVSDEEVEEVVNHLKSFGPPQYMSGVVEGPEDERADDIDMVLGLGAGENSDDALYDQAVAIVARDRKCSTSYIQRKLGIGYNKAAKLVEQMEDQGVVTSANHVGKREILIEER